jgi:hypothetical protein
MKAVRWCRGLPQRTLEKLAEAFTAYQRLCEAIRGCHRLPEAVGSFQRLPGGASFYQGMLEVVRTVGSYWRLVETPRNFKDC